MRLNEFIQLSSAEQKKEIEKVKQKLIISYKELSDIGVWNKNASKELKKSGGTILWEAKP